MDTALSRLYRCGYRYQEGRGVNEGNRATVLLIVPMAVNQEPASSLHLYIGAETHSAYLLILPISDQVDQRKRRLPFPVMGGILENFFLLSPLIAFCVMFSFLGSFLL